MLATKQEGASKVLPLRKGVSHKDVGFSVIVCFTSQMSWGSLLYYLFLRRETRIPGVAPFSFQIRIRDLFVHRGQKSYTPTAFGKLWTTPGVRCMKHASS